MTRRADARLVFRIELGSILCDYNARFGRASNTGVKNAGVTSDLGIAVSIADTGGCHAEAFVSYFCRHLQYTVG